MALDAAAESHAAQRDSVVNRAVVPHLGRLADHNAHAVIDEDASADAGAGMNFYSGQKAPDVTNPSCKSAPTLNPAPVRGAMNGQSVQSGVAEEHLPGRACGRIAFKNGAHVFLDSFKHDGNPLFVSVVWICIGFFAARPATFFHQKSLLPAHFFIVARKRTELSFLQQFRFVLIAAFLFPHAVDGAKQSPHRCRAACRLPAA